LLSLLFLLPLLVLLTPSWLLSSFFVYLC